MTLHLYCLHATICTERFSVYARQTNRNRNLYHKRNYYRSRKRYPYRNSDRNSNRNSNCNVVRAREVDIAHHFNVSLLIILGNRGSICSTSGKF